MRRFLVYWLPPLVWMAAIFICSAQPDLPHAPAPLLDLLLKKAGHAVAYGILAWLKLRLLLHYFEDRYAAAFLRFASVALTIAYALSDEYHQRFVPGRNGNLADVGVDALGACCAMLLHGWLTARRIKLRLRTCSGGDCRGEVDFARTPGEKRLKGAISTEADWKSPL